MAKNMDKSNKGLDTKKFFPSVNDRQKLNLAINFHTTQFFSAHGNFKSYLNRFKLIGSDMCLCSKSPETIWHRLYDCDMHLKSRQSLINVTHHLGLKWPLEPDRIIKYNRLYIELLSFIYNI